MNEFEKFMEWRDQNIKEISEWPERLYIAALQEAYDHKLSYTKTRSELQNFKPALPSTYHGTAPETFAYGITSNIIDDAIQLVRKEEGNTIVSTPPVSDRNGKKSKKRD